MEHPQASVILSELPDQPIFNVKAVCVRTGITSSTLRAWERRYGLPSPNRSTQGYRLYSERDVAILHWLMQETIKGVHIGQAVEQLHDILASGQELLIPLPSPSSPPGDFTPRSPEVLAAELADAYIGLSERRCNEVITEALAIYTLETTMFLILRGALTILHEEVVRGTVLATIENFALNHLRHRLERMLQMTPLRPSKRYLMLIGFANEGSGLDLIMLAILLRRAGHEAIFMVAAFEPELLRSEVAALRASLIMFYCHDPDNALMLKALPTTINRDEAGALTPMVYAGEAAMIMPTLSETLPFGYIGDDLKVIYRELLERLRHIELIESDKV